MAFTYPPPGFHFKVEFLDIQAVEDDILFQSVSGLNVSLQTETIKEGGENRFEHALPVRTKVGDLVLKRGLFVGSGVYKWCENAFQNFEFQPVNILVSLLNESVRANCSVILSVHERRADLDEEGRTASTGPDGGAR